MKNVTEQFVEFFAAVKGIAIYKNITMEDEYYVEAFDFNRTGHPINFHPLTDKESAAFCDTLKPIDNRASFLHINQLISPNILFMSPAAGSAVWYTAAQKVPLFFKESLGIPSGSGYVPPLVWKADRETLSLYALQKNHRPGPPTPLFRAPFFNTASDGSVCLGNVEINFEQNCSLEKFIIQWQHYFYASYFSHLNGDSSPVNCNVVQLWKEQVTTNRKFPTECLLPLHGITLKTILE